MDLLASRVCVNLLGSTLGGGSALIQKSSWWICPKQLMCQDSELKTPKWGIATTKLLWILKMAPLEKKVVYISFHQFHSFHVEHGEIKGIPLLFQHICICIFKNRLLDTDLYVQLCTYMNAYCKYMCTLKLYKYTLGISYMDLLSCFPKSHCDHPIWF